VISRALALAIVVATAYVARRAGGTAGASTGTAMALGLALIAATLAGELFERLKLPRVTGYLAFGVLCGPYLGNLVSRAMAGELQFINGLAVALIAFMAGLELNLQHLGPRLGSMLRMGAVTLAFGYVVLFGLLWSVWPWLPIDPGSAGAQRVVQPLLLTTVIVSFSPTVTIAVIADSRARGPLSELVISLVVLADLALILGFTLVMQAGRWVSGQQGSEVPLVVMLGWEVVGSLAFGALVGALFGLYLRYIGRELTVALLAMCTFLFVGGEVWHFEALLAALAAGLVVENVAGIRGDALRNAVERGSLPVLVVFFAVAGMSLHLDALARVGLAAVALALVRVMVIRGSTWLGTRASGVDPQHGNAAWMGLVSQAGVTLGLTIIIAKEFPGWGESLQTLMVAMIALHEVVGPVLFKAALTRAGEVGRMDETARDEPDAGPLPAPAVTR
jgi:Kef-type K+ transport system membrane component KefB